MGVNMRRSVKFFLGFLSFAAVFSIIFFPAYFVPKNKTTSTTVAPTTIPIDYTTAEGSGEGSGSGFGVDDTPDNLFAPSYRISAWRDDRINDGVLAMSFRETAASILYT